MIRAPGNHRGGEFCYLKMIAEEIEKSYPPGSVFTEESLMYVNRKFRAEFSFIYSDRSLKMKFRSVKKQYENFSQLLNEDGIFWNQTNNTLYGDEKVLKEKCRDRYRHGFYHGEGNYDLMCQIFESGVKFP